ncbi:MAG: hypothetical protein ACFCUI_12975 [Bernardetiaceae bacterium]
MSFAEYIQDPRIQLTFKSAWVHLIVQLAAAYLVLGEQMLLLLIFITSFPGILYFAFQFPITGLLILQSQNIAFRKLPPAQVLQRALLWAFLFALFGAGIAWLILTSGSLVNLTESDNIPSAILQNFQIAFVQFLPVLFCGELIRQRLYFKQIYGKNY